MLTKEVKLAMKRDRLSKITGKGKSTPGIIRKLQREIRNLEK